MQGRLRELKAQRHAEQEQRNHAASAHFIEAARALLGKDMLRRIWEKSHELADAAKSRPHDRG